MAGLQTRGAAADCALGGWYWHVWLYPQLGRNCPYLAGHWRCQHPAAGAAGAAPHRHHSFYLCAGYRDDGGVLCGHGPGRRAVQPVGTTPESTACVMSEPVVLTE